MADSFGIGLIADRQPRPRDDGRHSKSGKAAPSAATASEAQAAGEEQRHASFNRPMTGFEEELPEGTLFTVALLANSKPMRPAVDEVLLRFAHDWEPPSSDLRLADKKI